MLHMTTFLAHINHRAQKVSLEYTHAPASFSLPLSVHNVQTSPLKPLGQSKPQFHVEPPWEGGTNVYINGLGHMTKVAVMPIYGKNL